MKVFGSLIIFCLVSAISCMDQLKIRFEWKQLDYEFPSQQQRDEAIASGTFIPENNIPVGLEVYQDRLFITVPRWRKGVPAGLSYVNLNDNSTSPKLIPYPNWAAHTNTSGVLPELLSPIRTRADRCGRLWVLDGGKVESREVNNTSPKTYPARLTVYDLKTDTFLKSFNINGTLAKQDSGFATIAVEDSDCEKTYAYVADVGKAGIAVFSWETNGSWRISHHFFNPDPLACDFNVKNLTFTWTDAVFGMGISAPNPDGFSTLYFHPMASFDEFAVSTEYLRNATLANNNFEAFKKLGNRGPNSQSSVSFLDPKTGVLFYSLVNLDAVACWKTTNKDYLMENQGRIYMNHETMVYPTDIKVDYNDNLWILSNRMPVWTYSKLDANEVNFRVFSAPVLEAISHTACDVTPRTDILDKFVNKIKNVTNKISNKLKPNSANRSTLSLFVLAVTSCLIAMLFSN